MVILMVALENKFGPFKELGISNLKSKSVGESENNEDSKKELEKDQVLVPSPVISI